MTEAQIRQIITSGAFPDGAEKATLVETHISWVLLTEKYAYKIKKPVRYSFLDFSTLEKRQHYCRRELELNNRLTSGVYLQVLPVRNGKDGPVIGREEGEVVDCALQMKRLDNSRQMNRLLEEGKVTPEDMRKVARQLAVFHAYTDIIDEPVDIEEMIDTFGDLADERDFIGERLGALAAEKIDEVIGFAGDFLRNHAARLQERVKKGFFVDGHGDLHSRNIFLLDEPVIFDCIEFSNSLRRQDVLNEIAFFCLDLNFYGRRELEAHFLHHYLRELPCISGDEDWRLFHYFKLYRANVRLKVSAMSAMQAKEAEKRAHRLDQVEEYFQLFKEYYSVLREEEQADGA